MRFIDPDGMDEWEINNQGQIVNRVKTDQHDAFFMVDTDGTRVDGQSISFEYGTVSQSTVTVEHESGDWTYDQYAVNGSDNANSLFTFMSDNTKVEFSYGTFSTKEGQKSNILTTIHRETTEGGMGDVIMKQYIDGNSLIEHTHSHPKQFKEGGSFPSGLPGNPFFGTGDIKFAKQIVDFYNPNTIFNIYLPYSKETIKYSPNSTKADYKYFNKTR